MRANGAQRRAYRGPEWNELPVRAANALRRGGYKTPREAFEKGEEYLVSTVDGFGRQSWKACTELVGGPMPSL